MKYIVNKSNMALEACGVKVGRNSYVAVESDEKAEAFIKQSWIACFVKGGFIAMQDTVPAEMKTTAEQLAEAKQEVVDLKAEALSEIEKRDKEIVSLKTEALSEIEKRDNEIASLKAQLAAISAQA